MLSEAERSCGCKNGYSYSPARLCRLTGFVGFESFYDFETVSIYEVRLSVFWLLFLSNVLLFVSLLNV